VIISFRDSETQKVWERITSKKFSSDIQKLAQRRLLMLDAAEILQDLRIPPGNRLEALQGKRKGQHSIRVNDQWRICFMWTKNGPENVEIVDYH
jgi:proteic killer suppression protein